MMIIRFSSFALVVVTITLVLRLTWGFVILTTTTTALSPPIRIVAGTTIRTTALCYPRHEEDKKKDSDDSNYGCTTDTGTVAQLPSRSAFLASLAASLIPSVAAAAETLNESATSTAPKETTTSRKETNASSSSAREESISGFVAGATLVATKTLVKYPLDTATVRLQMPDSSYSIRNAATLFDGSYRGVLAPLLSNIPAGAVFFSVKDFIKAYLTDTTSYGRTTKTFVSVAVAQFPYWIVRNPSEVVKTRQQANLPGYDESATAIDAYKKVRQDRIDELTVNMNRRDSSSSSGGGGGTGTTGWLSGLDAFYTGYGENILYAYPADVIKFLCYEELTQGRKNLPPAESALAGAIATAIAQFITTPLDVVRNRVMAEQIRRTDADDQEEDLSYLQSFVQIARNEGFAELFAGASPRVGKAILSGAIQFATYEETKQKIGKLFQVQGAGASGK